MIDFSDLLILMVVIWTAGKVFRVLKLPIVFGELIGGIIVGPVLLNLVDPNSELIKIIAELGIFFLMLHAGLENDPKELLRSSKKSFLIGVAGMIVPLGIAFFLSQAFGQSLISSFVIAIAISVTSIPIAARLFKESKLQKTEMAHLTLGSAIFGEIIALALFAIVLNLSEKGSIELMPLIYLIGKIVLFFAIVIYGGMKISPFLNRIIYFNNKGFTFTLIMALLMGIIAEKLGLHAMIGAFLAGLFIREEVIDPVTFSKVEDRVYGLSYGFFGPIFFASLAFYLDFKSLGTHWGIFLALLAVAFLGKLIGSSGASYFLQVGKIESLVLGLAMNSRGSIELIIASISLQKGLITQSTFSILVLLAFSATILSLLLTPYFAKKIQPVTH